MKKALCLCLVGFLPALCVVAQTGEGAKRGKFIPIDISKVCNMGFADEVANDSTGGWTDQGPTNDLSAFSIDKKTFASIEFKIVDPGTNAGKSCIMLKGPQRPYFPSEVAVDVGAAGAYIYLLHASAWTPGTGVAGKIELKYEEGPAETIPVVIGRDVANWWVPRSLENGQVGWFGEIKRGVPVGVYVSRFANPSQKRKIKRLVFHSGDAVWGIIGVSLSMERLPMLGDLDIISPASKESLRGIAEIKAIVPPGLAEAVTCRLGSLPWQPMTQKNNIWTTRINTTTLDNGYQSLMLVIEMPGKRAPYTIERTVKIANEYRYYVGDLHAHTSYSDGVQLPADAYKHALEVAKLDFFAITDHDGDLTVAEYEDIRKQARKFTKEGRFIGIAGFEWTRAIGHANVFETETCFLSSDLDIFYHEIQGNGGFAKFNHPGGTDFNDFAYCFSGDIGVSLMEVRSEKEEAEYIEALNQGWHIGADGSQDTHNATWGEGPHWTVALATQLTKAQILAALKRCRTYSTWDRNMELLFEINGHIMGDSFASKDDLAIRIKVKDPDPGDDIKEIILYEDGRPRLKATPNNSTYLMDLVIPAEKGKHHYFVKVIEGDGDKAWSSPIWVDCFGEE